MTFLFSQSIKWNDHTASPRVLPKVMFWEDSWGIPGFWLVGWRVWSMCVSMLWVLWRVPPLSTRVLIWALPASSSLSALKNANGAGVLMPGIITHLVHRGIWMTQTVSCILGSVSPCMRFRDASFSSCIICISLQKLVFICITYPENVCILSGCWLRGVRNRHGHGQAWIWRVQLLSFNKDKLSFSPMTQCHHFCNLIWPQEQGWAI